MGVWIFYLLALIPLVIGGVLWLSDRSITWQEWVMGSGVGFMLALIFQFVSIAGMTADIQTLSGKISSVVYYPEWVEEYQQAHYVTHYTGKKSYTTVYFTTEHRTHYPYWEAYTTIPDSHEISQDLYNQIARNFGGKVVVSQPYKSGFDSGDRNIYTVSQETDYVYPVTALRTWENKVKAAPTLFSFSPVPKTISVYDWPTNPDWMQSERLIGTAINSISILEFDRMNARLGATKQVNVIMVGFYGQDTSIAEWQKSKWIGGKKNDLVICYGWNNDGKAAWAKVFGWSDSEICKRDLETILLTHKIDNKILPLIEEEINSNYKIKNWNEFDYITVEPPTWSYIAFSIVLVISQILFWYWAQTNEFSKE